jgi:hypothetical protein
MRYVQAPNDMVKRSMLQTGPTPPTGELQLAIFLTGCFIVTLGACVYGISINIQAHNTIWPPLLALCAAIPLPIITWYRYFTAYIDYRVVQCFKIADELSNKS